MEEDVVTSFQLLERNFWCDARSLDRSGVCMKCQQKEVVTRRVFLIVVA
jgi:hypothetical protein